MRPFQQLRLWLRNGPTAERSFSGVAGLVALALLVWVAVPALSGASAARTASLDSGTGQEGGTSPSTTASPPPVVVVPRSGSTAATGPLPGQLPRTTSDSRTAAGTTGGTTATSPGDSSGTTTSTAGRSCPAATPNQGVSDTEIKVGIALVTIGALNSAIGIPSKGEQIKAWNATLADANHHGGAACRKLVPVYYEDNVIDSGAEHAACLQMQQDKVFAVLNNLFNAENLTCVAQAKIPNFWYTAPLTSQARKYAPYIIGYLPDYTRLIKQYVLGAQAVGWFKGATKIGILEDTCRPENNGVIERELTAAGYPSKTWSVYNYGCTTTGTGQEPDKDTAAAVQFRGAGVTHVLSVAYDKAPAFAKAAEQQSYTPKYAEMSDGGIESQDHTNPPQSKTFDGALDITADQIGVENTPGIKLNAATTRCRSIMKAAGLRDPLDPGAGTGGGLYGASCVQTALLVAAITHAPALNRASLTMGLVRAGQLELSYPAGPGRFTDPNLPTAGNFWRTEAYRASCNCWQVTSTPWRKQFS